MNEDQKNGDGSKSTELTLLADIKRYEVIEKEIREDILNPVVTAKNLAKQRLAEFKCFCKVGDLISEHPRLTYKVTRITPTYNNGYDVRGCKIKKNGEPEKTERYVASGYNPSKWKIVS